MGHRSYLTKVTDDIDVVGVTAALAYAEEEGLRDADGTVWDAGVYCCDLAVSPSTGEVYLRWCGDTDGSIWAARGWVNRTMHLCNASYEGISPDHSWHYFPLDNTGDAFLLAERIKSGDPLRAS